MQVKAQFIKDLWCRKLVKVTISPTWKSYLKYLSVHSESCFRFAQVQILRNESARITEQLLSVYVRTAVTTMSLWIKCGLIEERCLWRLSVLVPETWILHVLHIEWEDSLFRDFAGYEMRVSNAGTKPYVPCDSALLHGIFLLTPPQFCNFTTCQKTTKFSQAH